VEESLHLNFQAFAWCIFIFLHVVAFFSENAKSTNYETAIDQFAISLQTINYTF